MDLGDLLTRPRSLLALSAMSKLGRPFGATAFKDAADYANLRTATLLAEDMVRWGLVEIDVPEADPSPYLVRTTHLGRRVGRHAEEMQRQLLDSPARYKGDRLISTG